MNTEVFKRYADLLHAKVLEGIDIIESISIKDKLFQPTVVSISNALTIASQLQYEIEEAEKKAASVVEEQPKEE